MKNILKVVALGKDIGVACRSNAILGRWYAIIIVVIDVTEKREPDAGMTLEGFVEEIVMVCNLEMTGVLGAVVCGMTKQTGLVLVVEMVPRDGDIVAGVAYVKAAVGAGADSTVVDPDVVSLILDGDAVFVFACDIFYYQVPDDDVVAKQMAAAVLAPDAEIIWAVDGRVGADADYGLVGADIDASSSEIDGSLHLDDVRARRCTCGIRAEVSFVGDRDSRAVGAAGGAVEVGGETGVRIGDGIVRCPPCW